MIGNGGELYGTTTYGGSGYGTVFSLTPPSSPGGAWTETVLHEFIVNVDNCCDGTNPYGGVVIGKGGVLYGTTSGGDCYTITQPRLGGGAVFALYPPASPGGTWKEKLLSDPSQPFCSYKSLPPFGFGLYSSVVIGNGGVAYGSTRNPACLRPVGCVSSTVFALDPPVSPGGGWTGTVIDGRTEILLLMLLSLLWSSA